MKQLLQDLRSHEVVVEEVPPPSCLPDGVLVKSAASLISSGTERATISLGGRSLLGKAFERPDLVRQVFRRLKTAGVTDVIATVRSRLDTSIALGYSSGGLVLLGQLVPQIVQAAGCVVWGVDTDPDGVRLARELAADYGCESRAWERSPWSAVGQHEHGADAVILTGATRSAEPVELAGRV